MLLDGNIMHAITRLRGLSGASPPNLLRYSHILFNRWQRQDSIAKYGTYRGEWETGWQERVPWLLGHEPARVPYERKSKYKKM